MTDRPDVAALLPPIEAVDAVPPELLPGLVAGLAALQARAAARLAVPVAAPPMNARPDCDDVIDDAREVARIVRRSVSWVRKCGHTLPGFLQPGGKGTRVAWSRRALEEWATRPTA
jgi:hypothetical protein